MLSETKIRKAEIRDKDYKLSDGRGLYVLVRKNGSKLFRVKYRFDGKEQLYSIGPFPEISLAEARNKLDEIRRKLRDGEDPKRRRTSGVRFEELAREWHTLQKPRWAPIHAADVIHSLERDVFPIIGQKGLDDIDAPTVLDVLRRTEARGALETARRVRQRISAVFVYGIAKGVCRADPAAMVAGALAPPKVKKKQPAVVDIEELRDILRKTDDADVYPITLLASRLLALTVVRPGVVRGARWEEFGNDVWRIPAARMKLEAKHKDDSDYDFDVPITPEIREVLQVTEKLTGGLDLLFPNQRHTHKPLSENAIGYLYNRLGWHRRHTPHGWRASFSTIMNERHPADRAIIDMMLAHKPQNKVEAAYNRAAHWSRRVELAKEWSALISDGVPKPRWARS